MTLLTKLTVAAAVIAVAVLTHSIFVLISFDPTQTKQVAGYVASKKVKAAMQYHGIGFAESDTNSNLWFWRDGQKCRLYTQAFMDSFYEKD